MDNVDGPLTSVSLFLLERESLASCYFGTSARRYMCIISGM